MEKENYQSNLRVWIERADNECWNSGLWWYQEAQTFCRQLSDVTGVEELKIAAVVSALSPNNKWERNKIDATNMITAYVDGKNMEDVKVCTYNANKRKAIKILNEGVEIIQDKSPKTYSFAKNVGELDGKHVTIDKWHMRACETTSKNYTDTRTTLTPNQYKKVEDWTFEVANEYDLKGYEFQAIVWVTIKKFWES